MKNNTRLQTVRRAVPNRLRTGPRPLVRTLRIEALEHRCPLDASAIAGGIGDFAVIGSERVNATVTPPAMISHAEDASRLPQITPVRGDEHEAFPEPDGSDRGVWQGPRLPEEIIDLKPETPPSESPGNAVQEPPSESGDPAASAAPDPLIPADRPLLDLGDALWRPDPVHFSAAERPTGSIGFNAQGDADEDGPAAIGLGPRGSGEAQRGMGNLAAGARSHVGERSETSLSRSRYFDSSDIDSDLGVNLQGETSSLLVFAHQVLSDEAGIGIGDTGDLAAKRHAAAHRRGDSSVPSRPVFSETDKHTTVSPVLQDEADAADLAIAALISTPNNPTHVPVTDKLPAADDRITSPQRGEPIAGTRVGITDPIEPDLQLPGRQRATESLADVSRWVVVGLLLSNHISNSIPHARRNAEVPD